MTSNLESRAEQNEADYPDKAEGPVTAAILAAGIGCLTLGIVTTLSEASVSFADKLALDDSVGPLSGKTIVTVVVWLVAWVVLHMFYRDKETESRRALTISLILIGLGVIGTFPLFFQLFASE